MSTAHKKIVQKYYSKRTHDYDRQKARTCARAITFHTFRHWKATMLYHQTKDIIYVKEFLGHKKIENTLKYVQLEKTLFMGQNDEFHAKVARKLKEACKLVEAGFEYVTDINGAKLFRKRK